MKAKLFLPCRTVLVVLPVLAFAIAGCTTSSTGKNTGIMQPPTVETGTNKVARLHVGDTVTVTLKGPPGDLIDPIVKPINEDGTITLDYIGRVEAAGKTPGELQNQIHDLYVPKYYTHLDVTVQTSNDRVYYVRGEVKTPGRIVYAGDITVSRAIASAGDFTDFADRSEVYLTRANGQRYELNLKRILAGQDPDPPVYPGDQIEVTRRVW